MKKSYLMIAAAAALFAACSQTDTFKDVDTQDAPIAFNQVVNKTTRATIDGATTAAAKQALAAAGGFGVFGYKNPGQNQTTIFNNVNVGSTDNGATWTYTPLRFWDKTQTYNFYAIAPYKASGYSITDGMFTISSAAYGKGTATATEDFIIDRDGNTGVSGDYTGTHATVDFDFHHVMAKVQFALKSTLSEGAITVTRLVMTGWDSGNGTFVQTETTTPNQLTSGEWSISTHGTGSVTLIGTGASDATIPLTCSTSATATAVTDWYIMVPQDITTLTFTLDFSYTNGTYSDTFTNQVATVSSQVWGTDSRTTYTLDVKPNPIVFNVTSICGFDAYDAQEGIEVK